MSTYILPASYWETFMIKKRYSKKYDVVVWKYPPIILNDASEGDLIKLITDFSGWKFIFIGSY